MGRAVPSLTSTTWSEWWEAARSPGWARGSGLLPPSASRGSRRPSRERHLAIAASIAVACGLAMAGCGGSSSANSPSTSAPGSSATTAPSARNRPAALPSPGCSPSGHAAGAQAPGSTVTISPVVDGVTRTVIVHLPSGYRPTVPTALVLNLHGSQSTAAQQEALTGMNSTADAEGFVVAYPQGAIPAGAGFEWNVPNEPLFGGASVPSSAPNDVSFLQKLVGLLGQRNCIDERRVYATGFSGGARMSSQLACDAAGTFAAVAPVSGLRRPTPCPATRPVPILAFHGTADPVDPYGGNGQAYWTYSVPVAAQRWAAQNACSPQSSTANPSAQLVITSYGNCRGGADVQLDTLVGEGHEWPGGAPLPKSITRVVGPQSNAVNANSAMWSFFVAHPLGS